MVTAGDDHFERESLPLLRDAGIAYEELSVQQMAARWPQINLDGCIGEFTSRKAGFLRRGLRARRCWMDFSRKAANIGKWLSCRAISTAVMGGLSLSDGSKLEADQYVFACGPWLGKLFPEAVGNRIRPTKQDVFFFGTPAGDDRFTEAKLPVWADHRDRFIYGIPGNPRKRLQGRR